MDTAFRRKGSGVELDGGGKEKRWDEEGMAHPFSFTSSVLIHSYCVPGTTLGAGHSCEDY